MNTKYTHVAVPKIIRYVTDTDPRDVWCNKNVTGYWGRSGWNPVIYMFTKEEDAVLFALVWTGRET